MTITYEFGDDPEALHRAMRLVLSWERPATSPALDPAPVLDQNHGSELETSKRSPRRSRAAG